MNSHDSLVAGIFFGVALILAGQGVIRLYCSLWAEKQARKAERIITHVPAAASSPVAQEAWETLGDHADQALALAAHTEQARKHIEAVTPLSVVGDVVPMQRNRRGGA